MTISPEAKTHAAVHSVGTEVIGRLRASRSMRLLPQRKRSREDGSGVMTISPEAETQAAVRRVIWASVEPWLWTWYNDASARKKALGQSTTRGGWLSRIVLSQMQRRVACGLRR